MKESINIMHIDAERLYVPTRYKAGVAVETDHKPITVTIVTAQWKKKDTNLTKQQLNWNLTKEAAVNKYKKETDNSEDMRKLWRNDNNFQQQYDQWEKCLQSILNNTCITRKKKPLTSGETKVIKYKMKQIRNTKKLRRDNRKKGKLDNTQIDKDIQDLQNEVSQSTTDMRQTELEEKISCILKKWKRSIKSNLENKKSSADRAK